VTRISRAASHARDAICSGSKRSRARRRAGLRLLDADHLGLKQISVCCCGGFPSFVSIPRSVLNFLRISLPGSSLISTARRLGRCIICDRQQVPSRLRSSFAEATTCPPDVMTSSIMKSRLPATSPPSTSLPVPYNELSRVPFFPNRHFRRHNARYDNLFLTRSVGTSVGRMSY
jgi:hypothetical protein